MYISENDKIVIRQLIEKQLRAFQENDQTTVFALTSPTIQNKFEAQDFMTEISSKYATIFRHRSIVFQQFTLINNYPGLVAMVMGQETELAKAIFVVQQQQDYSWRIHGYELLSLDKKII